MDILKGDAKILATKKEIRGVIVPRHDTAINWSKAVNFTPENGELIIISADNATDVARGYYLDSDGNILTSVTVNSNGVNKVCVIKPSDKVRFKFGNGKDNVNALPFQTEAIQGTASGSVIQIDDISPVTHEMGVKVRSKNLIPYPYASGSSYTTNGVTFTANDDGSVTLNGTPTTTAVYFMSLKSQITTEGNVYALSLRGNPDIKNIYIANNIYGGEHTGEQYSSLGGTYCIFTDKGATSANYYIVVLAGAGTLENVTVYPQLELGTTATDYTPYVADLSAVGVSRLGKNLFDKDNTLDGYEIDNATTGEIVANEEWFITDYIPVKEGFYYAPSGRTRGYSILFYNSEKEYVGYNALGLATNFIVPVGKAIAYLRTNVVVTEKETFMLELGTTATEYEPYTCQTVTANADGTVEGLTSISPNITVTTDTDGVLIDCEYLTNNYKPVLDNRIPKQTQSDWQQNDETANDYIKNRPGGYIDNDTIVKIPEKYLDIKNTNIVNGSKTGSLRTVGSTEESSVYTIGTNAFAEGSGTRASGSVSHAEGWDTKASGDYSHAEGNNTTASRPASHAEGSYTQASGSNSHAEGSYTKASGENSHAEGYSTKASGKSSHAEGGYTTASSNYQHVQGKFSIEDKNNTYADIIGNGSSDTNRSNASTVDWQGNAWYAGDVYVGSTSGKNKDDGSKKLATEEYTNNIINKKIEVSETAPTEEENKIWLQPMTTNVGAVDYIVEQGISGIWTERKWNSGRIDRLIDRQFFYTDNPDVLGYAQSLMANGFDGVVTIQLGHGAEAPTTYCMGQIICNGSDRCIVIIYGTNVIYTNSNQNNGWIGWYKFSGTAV